jgi:hypothetical protein
MPIDDLRRFAAQLAGPPPQLQHLPPPDDNSDLHNPPAYPRSRSSSPLQHLRNQVAAPLIDDETALRPDTPDHQGGFEPEPDPELPENPLTIPLIQSNLSLAMQPIEDENLPHYAAIDLGKMDIQCSKCQAYHFLCERRAKSSKTNPKFGTCCLDGKVLFPMLQQPPRELNNLYFGIDPDSSHFLKKIRYYNNAFAMASLGVKIDHSVTGAGGPQVFKIQGGLYHNYGQLLPNEDGSAKYAQIYFFDSADKQLDIRQSNNFHTGLHHNVLHKIQVR